MIELSINNTDCRNWKKRKVANIFLNSNNFNGEININIFEKLSELKYLYLFGNNICIKGDLKSLKNFNIQWRYQKLCK